MRDYDITSAESIINYAKKLKDKNLLELYKDLIDKYPYQGKGKFGQMIEKYHFKYEPNSDTEPDFPEAGLELKTTPLKILKNGEYRSKERLVLNIINYFNVVSEDFENSSFWRKNKHLLIIFYLWEKDLKEIEYLIKLIDDWEYPEEDLKVIKHDWNKINNKIKAGKAHELSEGDTFYLGACTKGSTAAKSLKEQPYSSILAKQRAYSLKQGYVNHIIANISKNEDEIYGKIIKQPEILEKHNLEDIVLAYFSPFYGKSPKEIEKHFKSNLNEKAKNYFANLTKLILGIKLDKQIEEFNKAGIIVKTIRLKENEMPKEDVSFPTFKYEELINTEWEDSDFKNILESKFFFVFYQYQNEKLILRKAQFWNMPNNDIMQAKEVWDKTINIIKTGNIVKSMSDSGRRFTNFPKKSENKVSHVRPHARNAQDTYPLPVIDKFTGLKDYTKHCFWLNAKYIKEYIYLS